jgi:hypothetical protein
MGKPAGPKRPEVGLVFPTDKKGGRYVTRIDVGTEGLADA